ncbi:MAG TPA: hypothetical protein VHT91_37550 [Kofleriaceae bacterium]|nr:hypothetical protein [Kofleriaceae bacterium]
MLRARRQRLALLAALLWIVSVVGLPAVHEGLHDLLAPHRHDLGGMVLIESLDDLTHVHDNGSLHYLGGDHTTSRPPRTRRGASHDGRPRLGTTSHGNGSLAHHAAAIRPATPPITAPLPVDRQETFVVAAIALEPIERACCTPMARGPPERPQSGA